MTANKLRVVTTHLQQEQIDTIKKISQSRKVTQAALIRRAIDNLITKYLEEGYDDETN